MARTDNQATTALFDGARGFTASAKTIPYEALAQLSRLHNEAHVDLRQGGILIRSPQACVLLMLFGATVLMAGDGSLKGDFAWFAAVLLGVLAMTRNYIRGIARSLRRVPLQDAVSDLRMLLLYTGTAWGTGAFVVMPGLPAPAFAVTFAALPCFALALILRDEKGVAGFCIPVTILSAAAAVMQAWPADVLVAGIIAMTGMTAAFLPAFIAMMRARSEIFTQLR